MIRNHEWEATYRLDMEEFLTTDTQSFDLDTTELSKAAEIIERKLGSNVTLIKLERIF